MGCTKQGGAEQDTIGRCWRISPASALLDRAAAPVRAASSSFWRSRAAFAASRVSSFSTSRRRGIQPRSSTMIVETLQTGLRQKSGLTMILSSRISTSNRRARAADPHHSKGAITGKCSRTISATQALSGIIGITT